jgi:hypothetical protein
MEASVTLGLDSGPFVDGIRKAEAASKTFTNRVGNLNTTIERAFRRDPGRRAENAITQGLGQLAQGNIPGAIESISGKLAGLGVVAGVGIGLAVEVFSKLKEGVDATDKAQKALREDLKLPMHLSIEAGNATEEITKVSKHLKDLNDEEKSWGNRISELLAGALPAGVGDAIVGPRQASRRKDEQEGRERLRELERGEGQRQLDLATADTDPSLQGRLNASMQKFDAAQAEALDKAIARHPKLFKGLDEEGARQKLENNPEIVPGLKEQLSAVEKHREFAADALAGQDEANKREFDTARRVVQMRKDGVDEETQKRVEAMMRIHDIEDNLKDRTLGDQARRSLQLEQMRQQETVDKGPKPFGGTPWGTLARQNWEDKFGYGSIDRSAIEGSLGYGGIARDALDKGEYDNPTDALIGTGSATAQQISDYNKNVGELDGRALTKNDLEVVMRKYWGK